MSETESGAFGAAEAEDVSFITASSHRQVVLGALTGGAKRPSEIESETKLNLSNASRALRQMRERGLVQCLTPDEKRARYYGLTEYGEDFVDAVGDRFEIGVGDGDE